MPWPVPDRHAAVSTEADVEVPEVVSLGVWRVATRPADRDQARTPRVAVVALLRVVPPVG
jgi:hypothetical protein